MEQYIDLEIEKIIIPEGRYRKEMGDIPSLAASIKAHGLLNPIVVNETMVLIAGERRLTAHKLLGLTTIKTLVKKADEIQHRVYEIIENLHRKDFTWKESAVATEELHKMLSSQTKGQWSERNTAEKVGGSSGNISEYLNLAEALKDAPDIFEGCKSKEQALKALKKHKIDEAKAELQLRKSKTSFGEKARNCVFHGDCLVLLDRLPERTVDALISDPIYGINVFEQRFVNREACPSIYKEDYNDTTENFKKLLPALISKASKVLKKDAAVLMFCGFQHAQYLIDLWKVEGFSMDVIPAIWARNISGGRTNRPEKYFNRCYDMFIYGTRGELNLAKQGTGNVIECSAISSLDREHPSEKPVALMDELITRLCLPGYVILDPMCGVGSTLVAAVKRACMPIGFELDTKYYESAVANVAKAMKFKDAGQADLIGRKE